MSSGNGERKILVGGLGRRPRLVRYSWAGREIEASSSLAAVVGLGLARPDGLLVVTTEEAWEEGKETLAREVGESVATIEPLLVDDSLWNLDALFRRLSGGLPRGASVDLDLAGGFRHVSLVLYLAALAAEAKGDITLAGTWYLPDVPRTSRPAHGAHAGARAPLQFEMAAEPMDLAALRFLVEWRAGLASFHENGSLVRLGEALDRRKAELFRRGDRDGGTSIQGLCQRLGELADALEHGLPLWVERFARRAIDELEAVSRDERRRAALPVDDEELARVLRVFEPLAGPRDGLPDLDEEELERELQLAAWYAKKGRPRNALLILREWMVNAVIHALGTGPLPEWAVHDLGRKAPEEIRQAWLDYRAVRNPVATRLSRLANRAGKYGIDGPTGSVIAAWQEVTTSRNRLAHAAFSADAKLTLPGALARSVLALIDQKIRPLLEVRDAWRLDLAGGMGRVVIQPVGHSPQLLETTVTRLEPDHLVILCSAETRAGAEEVLRGLRGTFEVRWVVLDDVRGCHRRAADIAREHGLVELFLAAREVRTVLTGGTSAMVALADRLGRGSVSMGIPCSRWILLEPVPADGQGEPGRLGEAICLDEGAGEGPEEPDEA